MHQEFSFTRTELAGSLGDLGTILPLAMGMILINGLDGIGLFFVVGLFYLGSGFYFRITFPVEPMKVISAYAIATGLSASEIQVACLWMALLLALLGGTGLIDRLTSVIAQPIIRGVQLSTGILLLSQGIRLMLGTTSFQLLQGAPEPFLRLQQLGPLPLGLICGAIFGLLALLLLNNRRYPAALVLVGCGLLTGLALSSRSSLELIAPGFHLPKLLPFGLPSLEQASFAFLVLVLPQLPMTVGNAVAATRDLAVRYFGSGARRVSGRALCLSMAAANALSFLVGGMPLCHGAGGLASRYRFGARTGGSNLMIGVIFIAAALFFGPHLVTVVSLLPLAVLGVLLVFAGAQLGLAGLDLVDRGELFVVLLIVGITLASNLAAGFLVGVGVHWLVQRFKLKI